MTSEKRRDDDQYIMATEKDRSDDFRPRPVAPSSTQSLSSLANSPGASVAAYCLSSILMTITNKYVLSGTGFNLNFLLLAVQSVVCIAAIQTCKTAGIITYRDFNSDEARKWFPISLLLIGMIYTGALALKYLSIPVYTIFKNLTIILIAYGEVLWFGSKITSLTLVSFGLMVLSSIIAAWADIQHAMGKHGAESAKAAEAMATLNAGYLWMMINSLCSAAYVLGMKKRIKLTHFKDFDTMYYNNLLTIPVLLLASLFIEDWSSANLNKNFPPASRNSIIFAMVFSGLSTVAISYSTAWCVRVTSSTTYSMTGALNKLPLAVLGIIFFDAPVTFGSTTAIGMGFISGIVYAWAKVKQNAQKVGASILPLTSSSSNGGVVSASSQSFSDGMKN